MNAKLKGILKAALIDSDKIQPAFHLDIIDQFVNPAADTARARTAQMINAAFIIQHTGATENLVSEAQDYMARMSGDPDWATLTRFYEKGLRIIKTETDIYFFNNPLLKLSIEELYERLEKEHEALQLDEFARQLQEIIFPEGAALWNKDDRQNQITALREKRRVKISKPNPDPVMRPAREILFTSNILATVPVDGNKLDELPVDESIKNRLGAVIAEKQKYWYDHPIPVGVSAEKNEALYGLRGLDEMMRFEKKCGATNQNEKLTCLLSVSTTHNGLHEFIKDYFEDEMRKAGQPDHLNVYMFTENDTRQILEEILEPLQKQFFPQEKKDILSGVFGVDGEYGRHYSFLKAIAAFWQVFINPQIKATFKIDLDQVFPQEQLVDETGESALEHFKSPLWGASGIDDQGRAIELGMIAGALVNEKDISGSLFTADVGFPQKDIVAADELIFYSRLPQAFSTEAEMMTRYNDEKPDGKDTVIQRVHVTGGTNGILINALRKHRPFTPSIIGRAEDQAYLLSVLFTNEPCLRYLHKSGLIMRHDKEAFARDAIEAAAVGKMIGDYVRILLFSYYARALPWPLKSIKDQIDPFTGCFVSLIPATLVFFRFALKAASFFANEEYGKACEFLSSGSVRLNDLLEILKDSSGNIKDVYKKEKKAWRLFYDILDKAEQGISSGDEFVLKIRQKAENIINKCYIGLC